jgi:hypothetical protein
MQSAQKRKSTAGLEYISGSGLDLPAEGQKARGPFKEGVLARKAPESPGVDSRNRHLFLRTFMDADFFEKGLDGTFASKELLDGDIHVA